MDGDAESEEEREHSSSAKDDPIDPSHMSDPPIVGGQSNERKEDGQREIKTGTPLCASVACAPDIQPEILNKPEDIGSTSNHTAELRITPVLLVTQGTNNIRDVATNTEHIQRGIKDESIQAMNMLFRNQKRSKHYCLCAFQIEIHVLYYLYRCDLLWP